ncbi:methionyl-tRNA formyltransferase-like protein [Donghicola mangrovi]|uniref:Methionyl-tRNA formyltransferase-like protein n=1 Tax=Donghicola mangrovi TaxID=2729614 RepID=A0A850Q329_9RHOB|nr:methionyl-tRNA formyltransferase-like protein [Donghicola mangrovi]NVO23506.1 methionyl-tRNA formyltransferase-like protein [Donghicola mangrovi]
MQELYQILRQAILNINECYFQLPIDGGSPVYRERVYCYELYHQMRLLWPKDCQFILNGEVDKRAHPLLTNLGAANKIPDLLVHTPGSMANNYAIIEVKSSNLEKSGIQKDLQTFEKFLAYVGYQRAIYLIFGWRAEDRIEKIEREARDLECKIPIEIWTHSAPNTLPQIIYINES